MSASSIRQWLPFNRFTVYRLRDLLICIAASTQYEVFGFDYHYTLKKTSVKNEDVCWSMKTFLAGIFVQIGFEQVGEGDFFIDLLIRHGMVEYDAVGHKHEKILA